MKKILSLIVVLALLLSAVSCIGNKNYDTLTYRYDYDLTEYIELAEYKGLSATGSRDEVTDEEVKNYIQSTIAFYAETADVTERGAKLGDTVYIDYVGTVDGSVYKGGSAENYKLQLGFGNFPAGFDEALVGLMIGESISIDLTFPAEYEANSELAGKDVHYEVTLNRITELVSPEYTDEFVRENFSHDTIEEFEAYIREVLNKQYKDLYYKEVIDQVWSVIVENTNVVKYPEKDLKKDYDAYIDALKAYVEYYEMRIEDYLGVYYQMTVDEFYVYAEDLVKKQIKEEMILYAIAREENITVSDEDYIERGTKYAVEQYGLESLAELEETYGTESIREMIMFDMVRELIADSAVLESAE